MPVAASVGATPVDLPLLAKRRELLRYLEALVPREPISLDGPPGRHSAPRIPPVPTLAAIAQLGALRLNARTAVISLVSREAQYVIAEATQSTSFSDINVHDDGDGLLFGNQTISIADSLCAWSVVHFEDTKQARNDGNPITVHGGDDAFMINDLSADDRFKDRPFVKGAAGLRFYAGVPLVSPQTGRSIGSYCILDTEPRDGLPPTSQTLLKELAAIAVSHLELARNALEKSRSEKMVRGLGAFVEGESSIRDWWERTSAHLGKTMPKARATAEYFGHSTGVARNSIVGMDHRIAADDSSDHTSGRDEPSANAGFGNPNLDRTLNSAAYQRMQSSHHKAPTTKATSLKDLVSRAGNIIREGAELDGVLFLDARMASLRTGRTMSRRDVEKTNGRQSEAETSASSHDQDPNRPCRILGMSSNESLGDDEVTPASNLNLFNERVLRVLLRRYPRGKIVHLDDISSASESEASATSASFSDGRGESTNSQKGRKRKVRVKISRADEISILTKTFTGAKSVAFWPLYDSQKERSLAAAFAYTCSSFRELTVEGELSYFAAFGNSMMAEVARIDALQADSAKADFIGSISHELRSPLHGILGSVEMLRESLFDALQTDLLHNIQVCGRTLLDTVEHLLDYSKTDNMLRPQSKRVRQLSSGPLNSQERDRSKGVHEVDLDLGLVCEEVTQAIASGFGRFDLERTSSADSIAKPVVLILDIDEPESALVNVQPGAIKRVLSNLVSNSLKYTRTGFVRVKLEMKSPVPAEGEEDGFVVRLTVQDSGQGISKRYLRDRLYTPFAQENSHAPGTGLGLSIVRQIVSSLQGSISIDSEQGRGTSVRITLPMVPARGEIEATSREAQETIASTRRLLKGKSIALVGFPPAEDPDTQDSTGEASGAHQRGLAFQGESIAHFFELSLGAEASRLTTISDCKSIPSLYVLELESAGKFAEEVAKSEVPVLVICPSTASAARWTNMQNQSTGDVRFYYTAQPIGPLRLSKLMVSIFGDLGPMSAVTPNQAEPWDQLFPGIAVAASRSEDDGRYPFPSNHHSQQAEVSKISMRSPPTTEARSRTSSTQDVNGTPKPHVLVVDDNAINLKLLQTFCKRLSLTHVSATNGLEALEAYKSAFHSPTPYKYVLMDINMPKMDGMEATRHIRQFERDEEEARSEVRTTLDSVDGGGGEYTKERHRASIIALTGLNSSLTQKEAFASGMDLFLTKPVKFADLKTLLLTLEEGPPHEVGSEEKGP